MKTYSVECDWTSHGLRCVVTLALPFPYGTGIRCCYVGVPASHPAFGCDYDELQIQVPRGLTFADGNCDFPVKGNDLWWLGTDYASCDDMDIGGKPLDHVKAECEQIAEALSKMA